MDSAMIWSILATPVVLVAAFFITKEITLLDSRNKFKEWFPEPILSFNLESGVFGLCIYTHFKDFLRNETRFTKPGDPKYFQKIKVWVPWTFTFSRNEADLRPIHTGTEAIMRSILDKLIFKETGKTAEYWKKLGLYDELVNRIAVKDTRLFVPFSGGVQDMEKQFKFFGDRPIEELLEQLGLS